MEAYILVNCEAGRSWEIAKAALKTGKAQIAHAVTGQYDVIAFVEFDNMDVLTEILGKFQAMEGVERTHTAVAIPQK